MKAIRPSLFEHPGYSGSYIRLVPDGDIVETLTAEIHATTALLKPLDDAVASSRYEAEKWSIKEVAGHLIDCERIYVYRALRISRGDAVALPGFDENAYTLHSNYHDRMMADIIDEFVNLRRSTVDFFGHLAPEMWLKQGTANEHPLSVRAAAWILAGHEMHHRAVIRERYLREEL